MEKSMNTNTAQLVRWQQDLTGQVFDPASFNVFWSELRQGAYGKIHQVQGIVELLDGSAWQLSFSVGNLPVETELPVERWLTGRPTRPSHLEVLGAELAIDSLTSTLQDCEISDELLANYQTQTRGKS
jgi:hypothetical protein